MIMTDFELNKVIAKALGYTCHESNNGDKVWIRKYNRSAGETDYFGLVDYCNNWNDLMPLLVDHKIGYRVPISMGDRNLYTAISFNGYRVSNENPQRALAECLLKVLQEKQGDE